MRALMLGPTTLLAVTLLTPFGAFGQWTPQATAVLNFCRQNPNDCSMSINNITGGWQRNYHGTRLNVLASTFKLVPLLAYGEAVAHGQMNPQTLISCDKWVEFWTGQDGGALQNAWIRLGQPQSVTLDQMVGAMLRESDNATPDYLLDQLSGEAMEDVISKYMPGYVDPPQSLGALFTSWMGTPQAPQAGATVLADYSGIESFGYRKQLGGLFSLLHNPATVQAQRSLCVRDGALAERLRRRAHSLPASPNQCGEP